MKNWLTKCEGARTETTETVYSLILVRGLALRLLAVEGARTLMKIIGLVDVEVSEEIGGVCRRCSWFAPICSRRKRNKGPANEQNNPTGLYQYDSFG